MKNPVPPELRPGIKPMLAKCAPGRHLPGCSAPGPAHYCPSGLRCMWLGEPPEPSPPR